MADEKDKDLLEPDDSATPDVTDDLPGEHLADAELPEPEPYEISAEEDEAEELEDASETDEESVDNEEADLADSDEETDPVDDPEQLDEAEQTAIAAASTRPVRKSASKVAKSEHVAKDQATPKRRGGTTKVARRKKRTTPAQFVRESAGELKKVVWPTSTQLRQYFIVVLVFVLLIIGYVTLLDLGFGTALLKLLAPEG